MEISRFLMHYLGAGTEFPFDILRDSVQKCGEHQPIRVVITDTDFDANFSSQKRNPEILRDASQRSSQFVLLQHRSLSPCVQLYRSIGVTVIEVKQMDDFPKVATELAQALFPESPHVV